MVLIPLTFSFFKYKLNDLLLPPRQWTSFLSAASTAGYVYLYAIYYFFFKTKSVFLKITMCIFIDFVICFSLQNVWLVPDCLLFWIHGTVQLGSGRALWHRRLCGLEPFCTQNLFNCENWLKLTWKETWKSCSRERSKGKPTRQWRPKKHYFHSEAQWKIKQINNKNPAHN